MRSPRSATRLASLSALASGFHSVLAQDRDVAAEFRPPALVPNERIRYTDPCDLLAKLVEAEILNQS